MSNTGTLKLHIPERHDPVKGSRDTRPRKVQEWIDALPLANLGETARQVYNALLELNSLNISAADRYKVMEQLRSTVQYVVNSLKKHYVGRPFPLPEKNRRIADLTRSLLNEMATGYKIIVSDADAPGARIDRRILAIALHRGMRYLSGILLRAYQVYDPYPARIWQEIYQLYRYAEHTGLATAPVADHEYTLVDSASIDDAFKQILLLALACPYRLRQGEVEQVYDALERWAPASSLNPADAKPKPQGLFVTNLDCDDAPTYLVLHGNENLSTCRLLDTQGLTRVIREEMLLAGEQAPAGTSKLVGGVSVDIMHRLLLSWGVIPKRKFSRAKKFAAVDVAMGLSAIHHFVSRADVLGSADTEGQDGKDALFRRPAEFAGAPTSTEAGNMPDFWEMGRAHVEWKRTSAGAIPTIEWNTDDAQSPTEENTAVPGEPATQTWKRLNVGAGGYCLLWDETHSTNAQVGELVSIPDGNDGEADGLAIGVIRWMKTAKDAGLQMGVQLLAPNAVPVATRRSGDNKCPYERGLLLPAIPAIQQPASLLTSPLTHRTGSTVIINTHGSERRVLLTKVIENTGTFAQFEFEPCEAMEGAQTDGVSGPQEFERIWSTL